MERNASSIDGKIALAQLPEVPNICNQVLREIWKNAALEDVILLEGPR